MGMEKLSKESEAVAPAQKSIRKHIEKCTVKLEHIYIYMYKVEAGSDISQTKSDSCYYTNIMIKKVKKPLRKKYVKRLSNLEWEWTNRQN